ncbi:MAG: hypothetical protein RXO30_09115, partial [Thermoproteus sp.]
SPLSYGPPKLPNLWVYIFFRLGPSAVSLGRGAHLDVVPAEVYTWIGRPQALETLPPPETPHAMSYQSLISIKAI